MTAAGGERPEPLSGDTLLPLDDDSGDVATPPTPWRIPAQEVGELIVSSPLRRLIPVRPPVSYGRIRISGREVVELDRPVVVGRRPRVVRAGEDLPPRLVAVESPSTDISRSHVEIRPDVDGVVVVDLHSTNGTKLLRGGAAPVQLYPGEHTLVVSGDVVDLGDGVTIAFEDLP